MTVDSVFMSQS